MRASALKDVPLLSKHGTELGTVSEVLFHPSSPIVVGLSVRPTRIGGLVARPERYVTLGVCRIEGDAVVADVKRLPRVDASERRSAFSWDETVQWRGMPVATASGSIVGSVADVIFDWDSGAVSMLEVSSGVVGDAAVGKLSAPGEAVVGYREGAVRLACEYAELKASGGLAKAAATGAAVLKEKGAAAARRAYDAGMSAAAAVGRSARTGAGKRMLDAVRKAVSDAMRED